jgi:hypothetical protein
MTKDEVLSKIYEYLLVETQKKENSDILNVACKKIGDLICMDDNVINKKLIFEPKTKAAYVYFRDGKTKVKKNYRNQG